MRATLLASGDTLAGYRIDDVIGIGGMAIVYAAEQISLGRLVALKVIAPQLAHDASFRERFRREGKHIAGLDHPNVVTVFDSGEADPAQVRERPPLCSDDRRHRSMLRLHPSRPSVQGLAAPRRSL